MNHSGVMSYSFISSTCNLLVQSVPTFICLQGVLDKLALGLKLGILASFLDFLKKLAEENILSFMKLCFLSQFLPPFVNTGRQDKHQKNTIGSGKPEERRTKNINTLGGQKHICNLKGQHSIC